MRSKMEGQLLVLLPLLVGYKAISSGHSRPSTSRGTSASALQRGKSLEGLHTFPRDGETVPITSDRIDAAELALKREPPYRPDAHT